MKYGLVTFAAIAVLVLLFSTYLPLRSSTIWGNDNYIFIPASPSLENVTVSISSTITTSTGYQGPVEGCSYASEWSYQWNTLNPSNSWIQSSVQVNPSGYSCFTVEYWPSIYDQTPDYFGLDIGHSNEFYQSGNAVKFSFTASSYKISLFSLYVPSEGWGIRPYQLTNSPSISYSSTSSAQMIMVGCCGGLNAWFTNGGGTIEYYHVNTIGTDASQSAESSNMGYNGLNYVSSETWSQTFVHCWDCI